MIENTSQFMQGDHMLKRRWLGLLSIILLGYCAAACAKEEVCVDTSVPPLMYEADGRAVGIYPALLAEISKRSGVELNVVAVPWKRALAELDAGRAGNGALYKNSDRLTKYDFSNKLFDEIQIVYVRSGHAFPFKGVESLKGKTVGVIRGWSYGDAFDAAVKDGSIKAEGVDSDEQNFKKMLIGRIDAMIAIKETAAAAIAAGAYKDKVTALSPPLSVSSAYIAFAKSAHKTDIIAKLNKAIQAIRDDGSFDLIINTVVGAPADSKPHDALEQKKP
jgi:polar amino acid transport system substrate-binding protein